jgi:hypothetical protein
MRLVLLKLFDSEGIPLRPAAMKLELSDDNRILIQDVHKAIGEHVMYGSGTGRFLEGDPAGYTTVQFDPNKDHELYVYTPTEVQLLQRQQGQQQHKQEQQQGSWQNARFLKWACGAQGG